MRYCSVALHHGAVGLSAVCDSGISYLCSLTLFKTCKLISVGRCVEIWAPVGIFG